MAQTKEPKKIYDIAKLTTKLKQWKIKVKFKLSLTPTEKEKEFRNLRKSGRRCAYLLKDDSGQIKLFAYDDIATRLESYDIQMDDGREYIIWGAEIKIADKDFYSYGHKYELQFIESAGIRPVEGEFLMKENGATCIASASHIAKTTGAEDTKKINLYFDPVPLKEVENYKSEPYFDVLGIIKKSSVPEPKQHKTCQFFVKKMRLIDTTGEVDISVIAKKKIELKKLTELKDEVIGLKGCEWKEYGKDLISAKLKNLIEEKDLPQSSLAEVRKLKEWAEQRPKPSPRKGTEKKSLHERAVGDPVQDPEIVPSKKSKIETNMPLTRSKANPVSTRLASTHPFSKGTHNQKCVLSSEIKAEVSRSVGLIYIDDKPAGTGFRVGEMYIITCVHVLEIFKVFTTRPHFIACNRMAIEFDRKKFNQRENPLQIFLFQRDIAYLDEEHDFVVLKLQCHQAGVGFPPPLTCFGEVSMSEIHLVGHPNGREMKEDDIFPYWSTEHEDKIRKLGNWSKDFFPDKKDYYSILLEPPRKILFDTTFDHGSSGSPGVMIRDDKPCLVLMLAGGTPKYIYDNAYSTTLKVEDHEKVEYGFPISDIFKKMWNSPKQKDKDLASNIFTEFI